MGICFFYGVGGYAMVLLQQVGFEIAHGGAQAGNISAKLALALGVGIMTGNLLAGLLSRRGVELGLTPLGGMMLVLSLAGLGYRQGAIRVAMSFLGILFGYWLAGPLSGPMAWLLKPLGVKSPIVLWLVPPFMNNCTTRFAWGA